MGLSIKENNYMEWHLKGRRTADWKVIPWHSEIILTRLAWLGDLEN